MTTMNFLSLIFLFSIYFQNNYIHTDKTFFEHGELKNFTRKRAFECYVPSTKAVNPIQDGLFLTFLGWEGGGFRPPYITLDRNVLLQ